MKKNSRLTRQINRLVIITSCLIMFFTCLLVFYLLTIEKKNSLTKDRQFTTNLIVHSLNVTDSMHDAQERTVDYLMYEKTLRLQDDLHGKMYDQISEDELKNLAKKYNFTGITLIVPQGDTMVMGRSTEPREVGNSMKGWGYWETSVKELYANKRVTTDKGFAKDHFWAGPMAISKWDTHTYFKFVYYHAPSTDYIICPFISDNGNSEIKLNKNTGPDELIQSILNDKDTLTVSGIGVFYTHGWYSEKANIKTFKRDSLLYGLDDMIEPNDRKYIQQMLDTNQPVIVKMEYHGQPAIKTFLPFTGDRMLVLTQSNKFNMTYLWIVLCSLLAGFIMIPFIISRFLTKKLMPISQMSDHLTRIASGDLSTLSDIQENNELGELAAHMNVTTLKMRDLVAKLNRKAVESVKRELEETGQVVENEFEHLLASIRSQRHDFKNHIQVVYGLLESGMFEVAANYMRDYTHAIQDVDTILKIHNPALLVFFNTKYMIATHDHIKFTLNTDYGKYDCIPIGDLITILSNLLDNAFEATMIQPPGNRQITVKLNQFETFYSLSVTNTGPMIPIEEQEKIFEGGYSTKRKSTEDWGSRGSGLSIVKQLAEYYGGSISLTSTHSQTTFQLTLPFVN